MEKQPEVKAAPEKLCCGSRAAQHMGSATPGDVLSGQRRQGHSVTLPHLLPLTCFHISLPCPLLSLPFSPAPSSSNSITTQPPERTTHWRPRHSSSHAADLCYAPSWGTSVPCHARCQGCDTSGATPMQNSQPHLQHFHLNPLNCPQKGLRSTARLLAVVEIVPSKEAVRSSQGQKAAVVISETTPAASQSSGSLGGSAGCCWD